MLFENGILSVNNILYELLIYAEWQQEPEILTKGNESRSNGVIDKGYLWKILAPFISFSSPPLSVKRLINLQLPWVFAIGGNGAVIAILQDTSLEIRTSRDEYGTVIGKTQVTNDVCPQWRKLLWSPDCTMLVLAHSNGQLDFYDLIGAHMFTIDKLVQSAPTNGNHCCSFAIAGMTFTDVRVKNTQWSYEFIAANYRGTIYSFYISPSEGFQASHSFSLSSYYTSGITSLAYNRIDNLLIVCGKSQKLNFIQGTQEASQKGLSVWRLLSEYPHYKLALSKDDENCFSKRSWKNILSQYKFYQNSEEDFIFKMSISPGGKLLATIHTSGALSLWDLPSLKLRNCWPLNLQPNFNDVNPQYSEPGMKKNAANLLGDPFNSHILDINWWSDDALIMVRRCGAVTVSSISSLQNLLGVSPEWFEPSPSVTSFCDRGFLVIEREIRLKRKRREVDDTGSDEEDSSDDDEPSIFAYSYEIAQRALYFITDLDRFQPPRRKSKMMTKVYRLLCLKSTTPEELYVRKINNEEYGEALALAKTYNLDTDLVYQRQWRKMPATVESIHDYLSKIKKRSWVLHECLERVPDSFEATKELLNYGLQGTDAKALVAIGRGEDHGRFIITSPYDDVDDEYQEPFAYDINYDMGEIYELRKMQQQQRRAAMLREVDFKNLTLEQKQLCQCRLKLLFYVDRLATYEMILGGPVIGPQHFDSEFFKLFRSQSGLEAAIYFASNSNWEAVATLFTHVGSETLPHRLPILNFFPETTSPTDYQSLLPLFNDFDMVFYPWHEQKLRDLDWCETKFDKVTLAEEYFDDFYDKNKELLKYRQLHLSVELVMEWFIDRAQQVESRTGLVDNALQLLKLGMQRNIQGLEKLYDDLKTLELLIYECGIKRDLNLFDFQELSDFEKVKLLMSSVAKENFILQFQDWLMPFLIQCEKYEEGSGKPLLRSYVLLISKDDLSYCKLLLEFLKSECCPILNDFNDIISLALECVYSCERTDELKNANHIHDILLSFPDYFNKNVKKLYNLPLAVSDLKKHIRVADILDRNDLSITLSMVQSLSNNFDEVKKMLVKLTRMASHKIPVLEQEEWTNLLSDILEMQKILFKCISYDDCYEIILHSLLCSGITKNIAFAGKMMECNNKKKKEKHFIGPMSFKLSYLKSVNLVLAASHEYFNSASDASDPCISHAKACLNLIEDTPSNIEEEMDLISSISLLQEFGVQILPLQVRLSENRMNIVQEALQKRGRNYKMAQKIMKLAFLLRAGGPDKLQREGKVLIVLGEYAYKVKDYKECYSSCKKLIERGYKEGWMVCYTLGQCNEFDDVSARSSLMSFALAYCSEDLIKTVLKSKSDLELQVLQERVKFLVGDLPIHFPSRDTEDKENSQSESDNTGNVLWQKGERTFQVLQSTTQTAKTVLTSVKSVQFWKDAVNWVQPPGLIWRSSTSNLEENNNADLSKQGVCAFYDCLIENPHINVFEANYERYARPDLHQQLEISSSIFYASLIQDALRTESSSSSLECSVVLDVAKAYLPEDLMYSLCVLLSLEKPEKSEALLSSLPSSPVVLQFASLFYAIKIYIKLGMSPFPEDFSTGIDPISFIKQVSSMKDSNELLNKKKTSNTYWSLLQKYNKMLYDFIQAEILHSIGGGVDATRFANDDEYKKDTILGISMTLDDSVFNTALSLAHHYQVPLWDLYMTHLEYLFSESSISSVIINERIEKFKLVDKLLEQKKQFENRLKGCVYPGIDGKEHDKLLICFSLMEECGDNEDSLKLKPSVHKTLLKKLKAALNNIDYKSVMSPDLSQQYITNILNESSVHVFAKAASNIPKQGGEFYDSSNIYCLWAQKEFFEGNSLSSKNPSNKTEWILRFKSCSDMLQRLEPSDIVIFVDAVIFSDKALQKISIDCRLEIIKQVIKLCRAKCSKYKSNILLSNEWNESAVILSSYQCHLQRLEDETLVQLRESYDPKVKKYCKEFDLSKSSIEKLHELLATIILEGPDLELLKTFISCCPADIGWEPSDAYIEAINILLKQLKQSQCSSNMNFPTTFIHTLETILEDISNKKDELMIEDIAAKMLNEFCQDVHVSVSIRLNILQLLEKTDCLSPEYGDLLLLYRTQAIVSSMFPDIQVSDEEIKEEFQRKILFENLLSLCRCVIHFQSLSKLLTSWPLFKAIENRDVSDDPWVKLLNNLIAVNSEEALAAAATIFQKALNYETFDEECCRFVFKRIKDKGKIIYVLKFALFTSYSDMHDEALATLTVNHQITKEDYDNELLDLILRHSLTVKIISTELYKPVVEFLLHCQDDSNQDSYKSIETVAKELFEAGHESEAGSILLIQTSTHTALSTYSSAIHFLQRWLNVNKS